MDDGSGGCCDAKGSGGDVDDVLMMPRAYAMRVVGVSAEAIMAIVVPST